MGFVRCVGSLVFSFVSRDGIKAKFRPLDIVVKDE